MKTDLLNKMNQKQMPIAHAWLCPMQVEPAKPINFPE